MTNFKRRAQRFTGKLRRRTIERAKDLVRGKRRDILAPDTPFVGASSQKTLASGSDAAEQPTNRSEQRFGALT